MNSKTGPKVSVIIPLFNQKQYIGEAIDSVLSQTYPNIEIIVVNDGSTDNPLSVLEKYEKNIILINQQNRGLAGARNAGIRHSSGEYLQFLDADDLIFPEKIQSQVDFLENNPEFGVSYSNFRSFEFFDKDKYRPPSIKLPGTVLDRLILGEVMAVHTFLLRKKCIEEAGLFDEGLECYEDRDFWVKIACAGVKFYCMDKVLALYRVHDASMTRDTLRQAKGKVVFIKKVKNYISSARVKPNVHIPKIEGEAYHNLAITLIDKGNKKEGFFELIKSYIMLLRTNPVSLPKRMISLLLRCMNAVMRRS